MAGSRRIEIQFLGKDVSAGKTAGQVESKFGKLSGKLEKAGNMAGKLLVGGVLAAGGAMVKFGNQASDLAETQSKVAQIFGKDSVDALEKFSDSAARNIGQSKQTALDAIGTFGVIGKGAGLAGDDLVGFSKRMDTLAGDMASFSNTSPEEAIDAIGSAMRGEAEPIRKYGVMLDDATLKSEAMKLGLIKTTKEALTPQQKVLAAQSAILRQTKDQQGDFARTSDGLANKQKILRAQFENMTTQLGQKALPIMLKVTDWGLKAIDWMKQHATLMKVVGGVVVALVGSLALFVKITKAVTAVQLAWNTAMLMNPIGLVVIAIAALVAALVIAYRNSETFRKIVKGAFDAVGAAAKWMWEGVIKPVFRFLVSTWLTVVGAIIHGAAEAFGWVPGIGPKLRKAAGWFDDFKKEVNKSLEATQDKKKITISTPGADTAISNLSTIKKLMHDIRSAKPQKAPTGGGLIGAGLGSNAGGTSNWRGGPTWVGEKGPEILNLPRGSRITPNNRAMAGGGSSPISINFYGLTGDPRAVGREVRKVLLDLKLANGQPLGLA
jgi:hypothetical protein